MRSRSTIYFEKRYCLLINSLILNQKISVTAFSANSSEKETIDRTCSFNINQIVYVNCIDVIEDGVRINDSEATVHFNLVGDKLFKKSDIATVKFDMNQQKVVKPESSTLFSKELKQGKGVLQYKFINLKTKTLSKGQFELNRDRRTQLQVQQSKDENSLKVEELMKFLVQKDQLIQKLQNKIEKLIAQTKNKSKSPQRDASKQKPLNLHIKVNTANDTIRRQNQRLIAKLIQVEQKVEELERQAQNFAKDRETYQRQVNILKKQKQNLAKMYDSRIQIKGRTASFIGSPSFMRSSNADIYAMNQSQSEWMQSHQNPTNITVNPPNQNHKRPSLIHQDSEISYKSKTNSQQAKLKNRKSMLASSYVPSQNRLQIQKNELDKSISQHEKLDEAALQKRISIKKQDFKWASVVFQRNQEIQILKMKLQSRTNQAKDLEKELQKCKVQLKKKQLEIKDLRRQSKKNLFFGQAGSSKQIKNRSDLEQEFQKMQAEFDKEKVRLQQQIQRLQQQRKDRQKELKNTKTNLLQTVERQKTIESKYAGLKKFTQKKEEEFIQYKEKSQLYDSINTRNKELEGMIKIIENKCDIYQKQNQRLTEMNNSLTIRLKDSQRDIEKFKRFEKDYEMAKNQNINYVKSIQSYEKQYVSLKRYCIQTEAAYNKYITKKRGRQNKTTEEDIREQKEIQQKLVQFSKMMNEAQLMFYKQQVQDLNEEKKCINQYYQRRIREEKDRILENKDISNQDKKAQMVDKQKELQKILMSKIDEFRVKMSRLERLYEEAQDRIHDKIESGRPISEQLRIIQKKISTFQQKEQQRIIERKSLKETIQMLNQQIKKSNSSSLLQAQIQSQTLNRNSSRNNPLLLSMMPDNIIKQKNSLLEEARQRSEASQQRTYQQNRKMNTQLVKENGQLKMKNQRLSMDFDKAERYRQERQKQFEQTLRKQQLQFKIKIENISEQLQKKTQQISLLQHKLNDNQSAVAKISEQATNLSFELEAKMTLIQQLEQKIVSYQLRMEQYEKSERMMLDEVSQIKKDSEHNKQELFLLIEERSNNFAKIQKIKDLETQKLKNIIQQLEIKMEAEMFQNIKSKERIEQIKERYEKLQKQTQQKLLNQKLDLQNKQAEFDKLYMKQYHTSKENEILQENLMDISTQIENKEVEIATLTYQLTKLNKEIGVYKQQSQKFQHLENRYKDDIKGLQLLLNDKVNQIKYFQEKYRQLQINVQYSAKDLERLGLSNIKAENDLKEYQQKYMAKQQQIIALKQEYSILQFERQKQEFFYQNLQKQNEQLKRQIVQLQKEVTRLKEAPANNNQSILKVSRKVSQSQYDCPSPGRKKQTMKQLQVPQSSFIGGGITPILSSSQSPHIFLKMSENPFEPKQSIRKTRTRKQPSNEVQNKRQEIEIHIESPQMDFIKQKKESSHIQINLDQVDNLRTSRKDEKRSSLGEKIKEQTEQNNNQSAKFVHNIQFGESQSVESLQNQRYEQQIKELQKQLYFNQQENQKLNEEVIELSRKIDELTQMQQQQQQPNQSLNRTQMGMFGASRRKLTLQIPYKENNEKEAQNKIDHSRIEQNINRTSSNLDISRMGNKQMLSNNSLMLLQQKYQAAQLDIQYLTNQLQNMKKQLQQHVNNNQRLIQQAQLCRNTIQDLNYSLEEARFQIQQCKTYIQFQQFYNQEKQLTASLKNQIEELNSEVFKKQSEISRLMNEHAQIIEQSNETRTQTINLYEGKTKLEGRIKQLTLTIQRLKIQYRKYEESSELEIVRLNQTVDDLKLRLNQKNEELNQLGEEYLLLQSQKQNLAQYIQQKQGSTHKMENESKKIEEKCSQLQQQLSKTDQKRQVLYKKIKQLQNEIIQRDQRMKNVSSESGLLVKKYQIKLQSSKQQALQLQARIQQKQKTIILLKNQISLYNEECQQLKDLNEQLNYQSTKVQKELKDIMTAYNQQIQSCKSVISSQEQQINNLKSIAKEKENQNTSLLKNLRNVEKERESYRYESLDYKNNLQKLKNTKNKESNQLNIQIQHKANECERLKATVEKLNKQIEDKGQNLNEMIQKYQIRQKVYKQKLEKYELLMEQFQNDFKKIEGRPSVQYHEQVLFENQMLKNRIDELQEQLSRKNDTKDKQQTIYIEFRKYKANKQREIQDLQAEMDKYGNKINQLEETTFLLRRQNQNLKQEVYSLQQTKNQLHTECEDLRENLSEVEQQLEFYKKRKLLDMQKLLNDTQ